MIIATYCIYQFIRRILSFDFRFAYAEMTKKRRSRRSFF